MNEYGDVFQIYTINAQICGDTVTVATPTGVSVPAVRKLIAKLTELIDSVPEYGYITIPTVTYAGMVAEPFDND